MVAVNCVVGNGKRYHFRNSKRASSRTEDTFRPCLAFLLGYVHAVLLTLMVLRFVSMPRVSAGLKVMKQHQGTVMPHILIPALLILAVAATTAIADNTPPFKITTKRGNDRVDVKAEKDKVTFSVHSPFGISNAVIERADEKWPDAVVFRFHLKGLESFSVSNDKVKLEASVSSQDSKVRLWKDGKEDTPLDAKCPYWMEIQVVGSDGKPAKPIPLKDGYFELQLPKSIIEGNPKSITLTWIDFYRN